MITVFAEPTPNPATLKFRFSQVLLNEAAFEFSSPSEAERSPLAYKIFGFPWTQSVFLGPDFISVTKQDWVDWDVLAEPLAGLIQEHLTHNEPLLIEISGEGPRAEDNEILETDSDIVKNIKKVINLEIRPAVAMDGGDISFRKFEDGVLHIQMKGACSGCPSSQATLKDGIEVRMKEIFPDIREVVAQ